MIKTSPRSQNPTHRTARKVTPSAELAAKLHDAIENYMPINNRSAYEAVGPLVRELVHAAEPTTYDNMRRTISMVNGLTSWRWMRTGCQLTPERILNDSTIALYVNTVLASHSHSYRFDTTRILGALATKLTGEKTHRLPAPDVTRLSPYTSAEMAIHFSWANALSTDLRRRNAYALLALGAGAGLSPAEIIGVRADDVTDDGYQRWITVRGDATRDVPVLTRWCRVLDQARTKAGDMLFHGHRLKEYEPRAIQNFINDNPSPIRLTPMRLRAGWIVEQINAGVPLNHIATLAGLTSVASVTDYLVHANTGSITDHLATITRGTEVAR